MGRAQEQCSNGFLFLKCCRCIPLLLLHLCPVCDTFHQGRSTDILNLVHSRSKKSIQVSGDFSAFQICDSCSAVRGELTFIFAPSSSGLPAFPGAYSESSSLHRCDSFSMVFFLNKIKCMFREAMVQSS